MLTDDRVEREEAGNVKFAKILREVPNLAGEPLVLEIAKRFFWLGWEGGMQYQAQRGGAAPSRLTEDGHG
jgi:hypothetical protein